MPGADAGAGRTGEAAFFDVDGTLIAVNSMAAFLRHHFRAAGRPPSAYEHALGRLRDLVQRGLPRAEVSRAYYRYYAGARTRDLAAQGREWFAAELAAAVAAGHGDGPFVPGTLAALQEHRRRGALIVLVSGSFAPCLDPVAHLLEADAVLAARPEAVDGVLTGRLLATMTGDEKAVAVRELLAARDIPAGRCHAYGDHVSDLPMLRAVGHPVVVGDDPDLTRLADAWRWPRLPGAVRT
ncbi:HAD family hydrolase [Streptomyces sp. NPDC048172]|uniref:HAD family hydrolase n=1 Tax=Streptomyces sp. NPDC048172 TaxID=3365505 RepID=UPI00371E9551